MRINNRIIDITISGRLTESSSGETHTNEFHSFIHSIYRKIFSLSPNTMNITLRYPISTTQKNHILQGCLSYLTPTLSFSFKTTHHHRPSSTPLTVSLPPHCYHYHSRRKAMRVETFLRSISTTIIGPVGAGEVFHSLASLQSGRDGGRGDGAAW